MFWALSHHLSHHAVLLFSPWLPLSKMILLICFPVISLQQRLQSSRDWASSSSLRDQLLGLCPALHKYLVTESIVSGTEKTNSKLIPLFTLRTFMGWLQPRFPRLAISLLSHLNPGTLVLGPQIGGLLTECPHACWPSLPSAQPNSVQGLSMFFPLCESTWSAHTHIYRALLCTHVVPGPSWMFCLHSSSPVILVYFMWSIQYIIIQIFMFFYFVTLYVY